MADIPHRVNGGMLLIKYDKQRRCGDAASQGSAVQSLFYIELHPFFQLVSYILSFPLSQVGNKNSRIKGAGAGFHGKLTNSFLFIVKITNVIVLKNKIFTASTR